MIPGSAGRTGRLLTAAGTAMLVATVVAVFSPCLFNGFVADDRGYILNNPAVREFSLRGFLRLWTTPFCHSYVPLTMVSFWADSFLWDSAAFGFHAVNLVLHLAVCLLVWLFAWRLTRKPATGFLAAILFAIHPLRVEAVAWVSSRKDLLSAVFFLAGLMAYDGWRQEGGRRRYGVALACSVCAILAKPSAVAFPLAALCVDFLRGRPLRRAAAVGLAPLFAVALAGAVATVVSQRALIGVDVTSVPAGILVPFRAAALYVEKTLLPVNLSVLYPVPSLSELLRDLPRCLFVVTSTAALLWLRGGRMGRFAVLFFFATLLPSLKVVPFAVGVAADRYTYVPSVGLSCWAAASCFAVFGKPGRLPVRIACASLLCVVALGFAALSRQRCGVWKDEVTLYSDAVANYPHAMTYTFRGLARGLVQEFPAAAADLTAALSLNPSPALLVRIYSNRAVAYGELGQIEKAYADYAAAIETGSRIPSATGETVEVYRKRGMLSAALGRYDDAITDFSRAISLAPRDGRLYVMRGNLFSATGDRQRALVDYTRGIEINPDDVVAWYNRALCHAAGGNHLAAVGDFTQALAISPQFVAARAMRAVSRLAAGDAEGARADAEEARRLGWVFPETFVREMEESGRPPARQGR